MDEREKQIQGNYEASCVLISLQVSNLENFNAEIFADRVRFTSDRLLTMKYVYKCFSILDRFLFYKCDQL